MRKIKEWLWNVLFLDFYLDKGWSVRFKILNLISGDALREYITALNMNFSNFTKYEEINEDKAALFYARKANHWFLKMWREYRR